MDSTLKLGSSVTITDPCYIPDALGHMAIQVEIIPGEWDPYVEESDEGTWGNRVKVLGITRGGFKNTSAKLIGYAGVDSGQMMFIDTQAINVWEDTEYDDAGAPDLSYAGACRLTLSDEQSGLLEDLAVVSTSGYGDGNYPVYAYEDSLGDVERLEVRFLEEEEEEWDDTEEEEDLSDFEWDD